MLCLQNRETYKHISKGGKLERKIDGLKVQNKEKCLRELKTESRNRSQSSPQETGGETEKYDGDEKL